MTSKVQPQQIIEPLAEKTCGRDCVIFSEQKNKEKTTKVVQRRPKMAENFRLYSPCNIDMPFICEGRNFYSIKI